MFVPMWVLVLLLVGCGSEEKEAPPRAPLPPTEAPAPETPPVSKDKSPETSPEAPETESPDTEDEPTSPKEEPPPIYQVTFTYKVGDEGHNSCRVNSGTVRDASKTFTIDQSDFQILTEDELCQLTGPSKLTCKIVNNGELRTGILCNYKSGYNGMPSYGYISLMSWSKPDLSDWEPGP